MSKFVKVLLCLLAVVLELFFIRLLDTNRLGFILAGIPLHLLAGLSFSWSLAVFFSDPRSWQKIMFFCVLFLGIYGQLGSFFLLALSRLRKQKGEVFHLDLDEEEEIEEEGDVFEEIPAAEILEVESFADILKDEDKQLRLGAITALQKLKDKDSIAMLSDSLDSTFQEVRYYAVEALNKIAQEYLDKITVLQQMVQIKPDDFVVRQTLGDIYFEYAAKGIEEEAIREYYYRLAREEYKILLKAQPDHLTILHNLMEASFMLADYPVCIKLAHFLLELEGADGHAIQRVGDSLLASGDFNGLKEFAMRIVNLAEVPVETRQAAEMWL